MDRKIPPEIREALEARGIDAVRSILSHYGPTLTQPLTDLKDKSGATVSRADAEAWLCEKDAVRERRDKLIFWFAAIAAVAAVLSLLR